MKILVTGPESSGKSTLARSLAWCLDGVYVEEQARPYLHGTQGSYGPADLPRILRRQLQAEAAAEALQPTLIFCDTGPEVLRVWALVKYGSVPDEVESAFLRRHYDAVLLCYPDLPWQRDRLREQPDAAERLRLYERYRVMLPDAVVVRGPARRQQALAALAAVQAIRIA